MEEPDAKELNDYIEACISAKTEELKTILAEKDAKIAELEKKLAGMEAEK